MKSVVSSYVSTQRQAQKRKVKLLAVASATLLLCTFVVKEILMMNLKDRCDSLATADAKYESELGTSTLSLQLFTMQQQIENDKVTVLNASKDVGPRDYSALISQSIGMVRQAEGNVNVSLEEVSNLIDALPEAGELGQLRDRVRSHVQETEKRTADTLRATAQHDTRRFVQVEFALIGTEIDEILVVVLGDTALTAIRRVREANETLLRWSTRMFRFLGLLGLGLGIYAAAVGIKLGD